MKLTNQIKLKNIPREKLKTRNFKSVILDGLKKNGVVILPPIEAKQAFELLEKSGITSTAVMLDPWYNKGVGGVRIDYKEFIDEILFTASKQTNHIYLWGFPEIVANFVNSLPSFELNAWLTWYYKNNPSVIRGWRSSQQACIHFCRNEAELYPQHFLTNEQNERLKTGKMRFIPGPASVIESSLLVGFIGKKEKTPHPAQKPIDVYDKLIRMVTQVNDLIVDPMAGSGTTGAVALSLKRKAVLSDISEEYTQIMEKRLGIKRLQLDN